MTGATWTVGAMFAQTSGLPLKIPIEGNSMDTQKEFFPGLTTLGDILDDAGYDQTLLIGSMVHSAEESCTLKNMEIMT